MGLVSVASPDDPRLDAFRSVADPERMRAEGRFVAEGRRVVEDLLEAGGYEVEALLLTTTASSALANALATLDDAVPVYVVEGPALSKAITGHRFHQGCVGLVRRPARRDVDDLPHLLETGRRLVVGLEGVTDPDNVGTIFRSARAFDADAVLLSPGCAHPLYRKALRTSLSATLRLPFAEPERWLDALRLLQGAGYRVLALTPRPSAHPVEEALGAGAPHRCLLLLGSEERGLDAETLAAADVQVRIPTERKVDSLNVAGAAAIALHRWYASVGPSTRTPRDLTG